jgi:hypothetical protein
MTTLIVNIENEAEARKVASALRLMRSVISVQEDVFEDIPGLPRTDEERIASVRRSVAEYRNNGISFTTAELRAGYLQK